MGRRIPPGPGQWLMGGELYRGSQVGLEGLRSDRCHCRRGKHPGSDHTNADGLSGFCRLSTENSHEGGQFSLLSAGGTHVKPGIFCVVIPRFLPSCPLIAYFVFLLALGLWALLPLLISGKVFVLSSLTMVQLVYTWFVHLIYF